MLWGRDSATIRVLSLGPLLKSGLGPWPVLHSQGDISRRHEQVYLPSDQDWKYDLERGHYLSHTRKNTVAIIRLLFKLSHGQLFKSGWALGLIWHPPGDHKSWDLNRSIFHLTKDWSGLRRGHYFSLYVFISFKLPIPTDKNLKITLLPRKSVERCERGTSSKDFVGMNLRFYF